MTPEKREEWDQMLIDPLPGASKSKASSTFTEDEEADSFMSAMAGRKG